MTEHREVWNVEDGKMVRRDRDTGARITGWRHDGTFVLHLDDIRPTKIPFKT